MSPELDPSLIPRKPEIDKVLRELETHKIVFVWAPSGHGKSGFAKNLRDITPKTSYVSFVVFTDNDPYEYYLDDEEREIAPDSKIVIVDEFDYSIDEPTYERVKEALTLDRKYIFLVHFPKNSYLNWRQHHKIHLPHMIDMIENHPDAPWIYLTKWKKKK